MARTRIDAPMCIALVALGGWIVLATARGRFWEADVDGHVGENPVVAPFARVEAVVPARDEAKTIGRALASLAKQHYDALAITLVDDASSDGTATIARSVAAATSRVAVDVAPARPLASPWTGKLNALDTGMECVVATRGVPDFWLFTDADIEHDSENVARLVAKAERDELDLVSLMVRLRCESAWERLLVPAFVFFFAKLYPFAWANDPARSTAAAAGGCVLVRASAMERIGGLCVIADRLIDDCALAREVKRSGGRTWIGLTAGTASIRSYDSLEPLWTMVRRTAFTQLGRSYALTVLATAGMGVLYLAPPALALAAVRARDLALASVSATAWTLMAALYLPTLRLYGRRKREAWLLPLAAAMYATMTVDSAIAHARGRGGLWKNRVVAEATAQP